MLFHKLTLGALGTNCYVLADENTQKAILVDAPDRADSIAEFLYEKNYTLTAIVLTHGHYDHILALPKLKANFCVPILVHENGADFLMDDNLNLGIYMGKKFEPMKPDRLLKDGDTVEFGDISLEVMHTPGHTSDSICLYGDGVLICGDTLFCGSVGRSDLPTGNMEQEINSIKNRILILPDETVVCPGHGELSTVGDERKGNPYLR
ncbi:MAG: MBL fold metallo-hydrolase [Clostridia bacterium]|nr:MBL fold metallo-hydrolase [Clostridia bacterium]